MKSSIRLRDVVFVLIILLCFSASAYELYRDFTGARVRDGERVGFIVYKNRQAEQKAGGSVLWAALRQNSPVYNYDTIRTGTASSATINFDNATKIELNEESMIVINIEGKTSTLSLEGGSVVIAGATDGKEVSLKTRDGTITATGGELAIRDTADGITVQAKSGTATVRTEANAALVAIEENARYNVNTAKIEPPAIVLTAPTQNQVFVSESGQEPIPFAWELRSEKQAVPSDTAPTEGADVALTEAAPATLVIASDPNFSETILIQENTENGATVYVPTGKYFWKIDGFDEVHSFTVLKAQAPALIAPVGATIPKIETPPDVLFSWSKAGDASRFLLEVFRKGETEQAILSRTTERRSVAFAIAEEGEYAWKVTALVGPKETPFVSEEGSFRVVNGKLLPPTLAPSVETSVFAITEGTSLLVWDPVPGAERYEVSITQETDPDASQNRAIISANFLKTEKALSPGAYKIFARSLAESVSSPWSTPCALTVRSIQALSPIAPVKDLSPAIMGQKMPFQWNDPNRGVRYRLVVSARPDLSDPFFDNIVQGTSYELALPQRTAGTFSWSVALLDSAGKPVATCVPENFTVLERPRQPVPLSPIRGIELNINTLDNLVFTWEKESEPTRYTVRLYRMAGGMRSLAGTWETKDASLTIADLTSLALDSFSWELTANREVNGFTIASDPVTSFFSIVQKERLAVPKIRKMSSREEF